MKITINGQKKTFEKPLNIKELLEFEGYRDMVVAVAHNYVFVPKDKYLATLIQEGDDIEIVAPMQGG